MAILVSNDTFWIVPVAITVARELLISLYRTFVGAKGVSVPASKIAKWKTFVQQLAVGFAIMPPTAFDAKWLWNGLLWASVALALISGGQYVYRAMKSAVTRCRWTPPRPTSPCERTCVVTSWPSAPSCCWARSPTPTASGSASSWPRSVSTRCCR
jgi:hypothetical protein